MRTVSVSLSLLLCTLTFGCMTAEEAEDPVIEVSSISCGAKVLEVIVKGRENRFGLDGQQVALDPGIPMDRICMRVVSSCQQTCASAKAKAQATGVRGFQDSDPVRLRQMGILADNFNAALGNSSNFRALGAASNTPPAGVDGGGGGGAAGPVACNAKLLQVVVKGKEHRFGFDGRQVALNPAIPIQNICQLVSSGCQSTCAAAASAAAASGIRGFSGDDNAVQLRQMGVLADQFNAALGNQSNFTNAPIILN
jgi:hypothetical protein